MSNTGDSPSPPPHQSLPVSLTDAELQLISTSFGIGEISQWQAITRGVGKADKFALRSSLQQDYLLKRRTWPTEQTASQEALRRLAFRHSLRQHLRHAGLPVEPYLPCGDSLPAVLLRSEQSYELMRFVHGTEYDRSSEASRDAGARLCQLHQALASFPGPVVSGLLSTWHDQTTLRPRILAVQERLSQSDEDPAYLLQLLDQVWACCRTAAGRVEAQQYGRWPSALIHGDWHPGNLIFKDQRVVSILDFESAGTAPRAIDVACGALHFSIRAHGDDPQQWPDEPDELRWYAFCTGYDAFDHDLVLSQAEVRALPWLMIEALIAEAVGALSATGRVGIVSARQMLEILVRKVGWLEQNAPRMVRLLE